MRTDENDVLRLLLAARQTAADLGHQGRHGDFGEVNAARHCVFLCV
jgi:hypothetical protein